VAQNDRLLGEAVLEDARIHQLLTIAGVNATVAIELLDRQTAVRGASRLFQPSDFMFDKAPSRIPAGGKSST
jgi:hypothetical protein